MEIKWDFITHYETVIDYAHSIPDSDIIIDYDS